MGRKTLIDMIGSAVNEDIATKLVADFTHAVKSIDETNFRLPSKTISPSMLGCERRMVFKLLGVKPTNVEKSPQLINICNYGTIRHQQIQEVLNKMKTLGMKWEFVNVEDYIKDHELNLVVKKPSDFENGVYETHLYSPEYNVSFLTDGILKYDGKYYILEIKTESPDKFLKQKDVQSEHRYQAIAYSLLFGIKDVIFLYEDRSYCSVKAYLYTPSRQDKSNLSILMLRCIDLAKNKVIPAKDSNIDKKFCQYCLFRSLCQKYENSYEYTEAI